ncbi:MAG: tRNA uridine-5-carboxymethylaminomethyl(34) synthesis GTPase MnmE [Thermoanaerobaculia bacterium]|nr:tRNA uridine-5-carboxymethylaminomethyl(34) synthesis GTPase MnmE [Thermoanaerobaculia bacterium]
MSGEELDTIVAPATPVGRSALAVVRIDGPGARRILCSLSGAEDWEPRRAARVELRRGEEAIDEAIALFFAAPASYTGNDLVELSLHGSPVTVRRLVDAVIEEGARIAEPGEFTERAVLNGKLDLVQAEAIADLIEARTDLQARLSLSNLRGGLSERAEAVRARLLDLISRLEAALDFADEGYEFISRKEALELVEESRGTISDLLASARRGMATTEGLTAVLMGRPNAGKSTLLNALVGSDRAIVTAVAGTTRDLLRETIEVGGLPLTIVDTAGLRKATEEVEEIGIRRTREAAAGADLILYLIDAEEGRSGEDDRELEALPGAVVVYTKRDLSSPPPGELSISGMTGEGLGELFALLDGWVEENWRVPEGRGVVVNRRQKANLSGALEALGRAAETLENESSEEIVLTDLYAAANAIGELTGAISHEEIVESIFSRFCIGK